MAKKKKRKSGRSKKSNPSTKKTRKRRKARRNPTHRTSSKRHTTKKRRKSRRNPARTYKGAVKKRRKSRHPESVILDIAKAAGVGLLAAGVAGIGAFVVGQKLSKGSNVLPQQQIRMLQGAIVLAGLGASYLIATKAKAPGLAAAAAAGTLAGVAGPDLVGAGVKAIATQQNPAAAAQAQGQAPATTQNGLSLNGLALRQGMNGLALAERGMSGVFDEGDSFT